MLFDYLTSGVKAGLAAGLVFGVFVALVANPFVGYVDALAHDDGSHELAEHSEAADAHDEADAHEEDAHADESANDEHDGSAGASGHDDAAVAPAVNEAVSVVAGSLWGVLLGGLVFGVGFYVLEPAIPGAGRTKSYVLAAAGFVTVSGAPWLVLPPRPPGVESSIPVATRLALYGGMMVAGALTCVLAAVVYRRASESRPRILATVLALSSFALLAIPVLLARTNGTGGGLPTDLEVGVTGMVVFGQGLLWLLLAVSHARFHSTPAPDVERSTSSTVAAGTTDR